MINARVFMVELDERRRLWRIGQEVIDEAAEGAVDRQLHLIPPRAFVEHAAEYGLDPADSRTILDWLLHIRFAQTDPSNPGLLCPYRNPPQVAWAAHQQQVAQVKSRVTITDPDGLLERIHQAHQPHPARVAQALERVAQTRAHVAHYEKNRRPHG